ncbi:MAG: hypothetical protein IKR72_02350, partial [Bacteroidales bacterium]|nr:hypothetical protein [Bacteroidales bacterium]
PYLFEVFLLLFNIGITGRLNTIRILLNLPEVLQKVRDFTGVVYTASQPFGAGFFVFRFVRPQQSLIMRTRCAFSPFHPQYRPVLRMKTL